MSRDDRTLLACIVILALAAVVPCIAASIGVEKIARAVESISITKE
jgi:hypothetical protein